MFYDFILGPFNFQVLRAFFSCPGHFTLLDDLIKLIERLRLQRDCVRQRVRQRVRVTSSFARGESHLAVVNV